MLLKISQNGDPYIKYRRFHITYIITYYLYISMVNASNFAWHLKRCILGNNFAFLSIFSDQGKLMTKKI